MGEMEVRLHLFFTSAPVGRQRSSCYGPFTSTKQSP